MKAGTCSAKAFNPFEFDNELELLREVMKRIEKWFCEEDPTLIASLEAPWQARFGTAENFSESSIVSRA